jgi:ribosomal protein S18 acetylase RimI-like enzyme
MLLEVRPTNAAARALYARAGFVQLGVRRDYYPAKPGREDALLLGRALRCEAGNA